MVSTTLCRIGDVCVVRKGDTITEKEATLGEVPVVAGGMKPSYFHDESNRLPGVITISASGANAGFVSYWDCPIWASDCTTVESKNPASVSSRYVFNYLKSIEATVISSFRRGAAQPHVYARDLQEIMIPLPPIEEQRRIASILDAADALRTKRRRVLAKLDTLTQAFFLDVFGDPVSNLFDWPTVPLAEVVQGKTGVKAGPFGSSLLKADYTESGYRVYGQEQVIAGRFDIGNYFISQEKYDQLSSCAVATGDLLISLVGSFGKVLVVPPDTPAGIINPRLLKITPDQNRIRSRFLATLLETSAVQRFLHEAAHGGTMGVLNAALVKAVSVMTPPIELQVKFENRLIALEEMMRPSHKAATVQNALFASLRHRAFRGEL